MFPITLVPSVVFLTIFVQTVTSADIILFEINDAQGDALPCRIHLKDSEGKAWDAPGQPFWHDHFICSGRVAADVPMGTYSYEVERGPEYERMSGEIQTIDGKSASVNVTLKRIAQLREEGWYSGDLHVHRPVAEIERLMLAEDLDFAPVIDWWNARGRDLDQADQTVFQIDGHRLYSIRAGEDEREGGALLYFGLNRPLDLNVKSREFPSPMQFVQQARELDQRVWIDIEKPFWWDVPTWLATGQMNSIGFANNHMCRSKMYLSEAWGRPRDLERLPNPRGNGFWTQEIYYHILNSGIRIPPSAGSASGVLPNPVGYNRVYVQLPESAPSTPREFTREAWFDGLSAGRSFVTNGPLLRVRVNGNWPGKALKLTEDNPLQLEFSIHVTSNDPVSSVEVLHNGQVIETISCSDKTDQQLSATLSIDEPGWLLVRAIADVEHTFRFASTSPWYLESDASPHHISRKSAQFFLGWVNERIERVKTNVTDIEQQQAVLLWHLQARDYWTQRVESATAD